jgi:YggT family protein
MIVEPVVRLIELAISLEMLLIIVRVALSWFPGVRPWSAPVRWLHRLTEPVLAPCRRILPSFGGLDISPVLALILLSALSRVVSQLGLGYLSLTGVVVSVIEQLVLTLIVLFALIVLLRLVLSLLHVDPYHPVVDIVRRASDPLVRPFSRAGAVSPRLRRVDVAAIAALAVYVILYVVAQIVFTLLQSSVA